MPTLFSDLPVEIFARVCIDVWVDAYEQSKAALLIAVATPLSAMSSGSLSTLKPRMPASSAYAISARVLADACENNLHGGTRQHGRGELPSDTTSMPAPSRAIVANTA